MPANNMPALIGIHGQQRTGKGTIANYLASAYGYKIIKFAEPIREMIRPLLRRAGIPESKIENYFEDDVLKETPIPLLGNRSTRHLMRCVGLQFRDAVDVKLFQYLAEGEITKQLQAGNRVAIDALRFPHELEFLKSQEAQLWWVERPGYTKPVTAATHPSEIPLPREEFHAAFINDKGIVELHRGIEQALLEWRLQIDNPNQRAMSPAL